MGWNRTVMESNARLPALISSRPRVNLSRHASTCRTAEHGETPRDPRSARPAHATAPAQPTLRQAVARGSRCPAAQAGHTPLLASHRHQATSRSTIRPRPRHADRDWVACSRSIRFDRSQTRRTLPDLCRRLRICAATGGHEPALSGLFPVLGCQGRPLWSVPPSARARLHVCIFTLAKALEVCVGWVYVGRSRSFTTPPVAPGRNNLRGGW